MGTSDAGGPGIRWLRWLVGINLGLVALQALSAGFLMSGYARALTLHTIIAATLQVGALIQVGAAVVLWRRRHVLARVAGGSVGLLAILLLQVALGYRRLYWLHVPIGVALVAGLQRQAIRLGSPARLRARLRSPVAKNDQ